MRKKTVFIHSLFRTGSTYLWNKFRQDGRYFCYYEPFHQDIAKLDIKNPSPWSCDRRTTRTMGHPDLDLDYMDEYKNLLKPGQEGVPFFKKSFSFDDFCNNGANPDQKKYIDFLIENAGDKIPLFQFNRSSLRIEWFKRYYPDGLHIYLVRTPHDQFNSYLSMQLEQNLDIFLVMDLITVGVNLNCELIKRLATRIPIFEYHSPRFEDEITVYRRLLPTYSVEEKYFIFYFIWFEALMENLLHADLILNINLLSMSRSYRDTIGQWLEIQKIDNIDFNDCKIRENSYRVLPMEKQDEIEQMIQTLILKQYTSGDIEKLNKNIDKENRVFLGIDAAKLETLKTKQLPGSTIHQERMQKYKLGFEHFSHALAELHHQVETLSRELEKNRLEISDLKKNVEKKEQLLSQVSQRLASEDEELAQKALQLNRLSQELNTKKQELMEKEEQLRHTSQLLEEKDMELVQKENKLKLTSELLGRKDRELTQKEKALKQTVQQLASGDKVLAQREQELSESSEILAHKDRELTQMEQQLLQTHDELIQKEQHLTRAHEEITRVEQELARANDTITQRDGQLEEKESLLQCVSEQLSEKESLLQSVDQRLSEKETEFKRILNSKSFKLGKFITSPFRLMKSVKKDNNRLPGTGENVE